MIYYAGIGSRKTPHYICDLMTKIAYVFAKLDYTLRSGGADGADSAFEQGCDKASGKKQIFLPWGGFNDKKGIFPPTVKAMEIASTYHPTWNKCSRGAKLLHSRNSHQILGRDCETPLSFVVCWHTGSGGTTQACRLAKDHKIPIINLAKDNELQWLLNRLRTKYSDICHECNL